MARAASERAPSRSSLLCITTSTFFSIPSAVQPRECAMYGNCGNWQPISPKKPMRMVGARHGYRSALLLKRRSVLLVSQVGWAHTAFEERQRAINRQGEQRRGNRAG